MSFRRFHAMHKNHRKMKLSDMQLMAALFRGSEIQTEERPNALDVDPFDGVRF